MFPSTTLPFVRMSIQSPMLCKVDGKSHKFFATPRGSSDDGRLVWMANRARALRTPPRALVPAVRLPRSGHSVPPRLERARFRFHATCDTPERHASKAAENRRHTPRGVFASIFSAHASSLPRRADPSIPRHLAETHRSHGIRAPDGRRRRQAQGGYPRDAHLGLFAWGEKRERGDESAARVRASGLRQAGREALRQGREGRSARAQEKEGCVAFSGRDS